VPQRRYIHIYLKNPLLNFCLVKKILIRRCARIVRTLVVFVTTVGFMPILQIFFMAVRCQMPDSTVSTTNSGVLDLSDMHLSYFPDKKCFSSSHVIIYAVSIVVIMIHCLVALGSSLLVFDDTPFYQNDEYWNPFAKVNGKQDLFTKIFYFEMKC
jgi:hypothetical protein